MKQSLYNFASTSLFKSVVTLAVIAILMFTVLYSLNFAQSQIETAMMETDLANIRWELRELWAHRNATGQSLASKEIDDANPFRLINEPPKNYSGELDQKPSDALAVWYFDSQSRRLVYIFKDGHQLRYRLTSTAKLDRASLGTLGSIDLVPD
jgi:hypothetical protein